MDQSWFRTSKDVDWLKQQYFNDDSNIIRIKKGEYLLKPDTRNERLFLIISGTLDGYIGESLEDPFKIFSSTKDMFIGVFSFFSSEHMSYSTVIAKEDSEVRYIDRSQPEVREAEFAKHFLPVIVNEIYLRQLVASKLSVERHAAIKKLAESEKMSTLGQLAAGIAHELNNALGVVQRNTVWLTENLNEYFRQEESAIYPFFKNSVENGQRHSSNMIRTRRKEIEKKYRLSPMMSKKLAKSGVGDEEIELIIKNGLNEFIPIKFMIDTGLSLHDMGVAARQGAHVVKSVKELGSTHKVEVVVTNIEETIREALALTKNMLIGVKLSTETEVDATILAHRGDLVQIWINLLKNASESLKGSNTENPEIAIKISEKSRNYIITITDNGPGISKELLPTIFQPNVTTKVDGLSFGFGLGLSIIKKIVESYEGAVSVSSIPGRTTFLVQLPKK